MLQFNKSLATNTNAVYLDTVNTGSGYYDSLVVVYSQSYDQSNGTFVVTTTSTPTQYNNWLIIQNTGSLVPDYTGQYDVDIWTNETIAATWETVAQLGIHIMKYGVRQVKNNQLLYYIQIEHGYQVVTKVA